MRVKGHRLYIIDREHTAYHEAGHVIAQFRKDFKPGHVTIDPPINSKALGLSCSEEEWDSLDRMTLSNEGVYTPTPEDIESSIIIRLSGHLTAIKRFPRRTDWLRWGAGNDYREAKDLKRRLPGKKMSYFIREATKLIDMPENWLAINYIAKDLLKYKVLDSTEIEYLIGIADNSMGLKRYRLMKWHGTESTQMLLTLPSHKGLSSVTD